ncbi:4a-hydroxytetrahydrobiopterin dehydratase [Tepidiforma thermophila]|uniref:Putative pterin-4-alpha-carbinolamine dehydratase n=1 Tax=Tepidiforma thermophila (strain KCTC 52669 / CGMCC 1.13589 / G233) TaxID=2761530 RepID=A0A2A9HGW5_TEPT2|nr:4a-hydroxytetrahydrobiopterin dehydratase [Tepidiforma thermophila]PFG75264.1 4a-hydroxytetrahydrobiopterin dehydratase [Tepidiforma thermophila]
MAERLTEAAIGEGLAGLSGWKAEGTAAISKTFRLKDHVAAVGLVMQVAVAAEVMNHHPEVAWVYNRVTFRLSTHDAGGVTALDLQLARKIEELAGGAG